jgi:hypothetical protein
MVAANEINKTEQKNMLVFSVVAAAAFLILLYGSVFKGIPMGINVLVFTAVCYLSMAAVFHKRFLSVLRESVFTTAAVMLLGVTFLLFNNLILLTINGFLIVMLVGAQYRYMLKRQKNALFSFDFVKDANVVWFGYTFGGMGGAFKSTGQDKKQSNLKGAVIGVAVTIPVLAAVIALLMSADLAFSDIMQNVFKGWNAADVFGNIIVGILLFFCAAGLIYSLHTRMPRMQERQEKLIQFNSVAIKLLVGCVDVVLAVFGVLQFAYLFAGNVPEGYTYATYAQTGFWQLVAVAVIVAAIVFLVKKSVIVQKENNKQIRFMLALLCALTEIILVSAFWRMALYEQAFSFSILRIFTQAFMVATAGVFIVLIISLAKPALNAGKWIFVVGMVCYLALNFMNADAFIARQNIAIGKESTDVPYLTQLSVDALPYYADKIEAEVLKGINGRFNDQEDSGQLEYEHLFLCKRLVDIREGVEKAASWQYYNIGREKAKAFLEEYSVAFDKAERYWETNRIMIFD